MEHEPIVEAFNQRPAKKGPIVSRTIAPNDLITVTVRLSPAMHRAIGVAAARSLTSVSAWLAKIGATAAAGANAMALVEELSAHPEIEQELENQAMQRALELLEISLAHSGEQTSQVCDVLAKLGNRLESRYGAREIREKK